jgi:NADPH-dependent 2,4-dienoyl-CoA reductase/sulfur reductase-like enzyme
MSYVDSLNNKVIKTYDIVIIGGGPAGLAAALRCSELGIKNILVVERDSYAGGILPQCIHGGFGLKIFNRELTGPEYSRIFVDKIKNTGVKVMLNTMALSIKTNSNKKTGNTGTSDSVIEITITGKTTGFKVLYSKSVILALGCREKTRGQIMIPGGRPAGVLTAGLAQRLVNIEGYLPGREIVILGSGDIGLIMARRLTLEGCKVKGVYELMPFSAGLLRNISQCLEDYDIPLYLSQTVTNIIGGKRLEAVEVCSVDSTLKPILSSARTVKCDTLLLSVGLIPENELSKTCGIILDKNTGGPIVSEDFQTSVQGIFSCGNSLFVYDLVDNVTEDGYKAAENAALYLATLDSGKDIIGRRAGAASKAAILSNADEVTFDLGDGIDKTDAGPAGPKEDIITNIKTGTKEGTNSNQDNLISILPGENVVYAVPQKISGRKDVDFKIRVKVPLKNATVELAGTAIKKKFKYVHPGEMLSINIQSRLFDKIFDNPRLNSVETATTQPQTDNKTTLDLKTSNGLKLGISKDITLNANMPECSVPNGILSKSITINIRGDRPL